MVAVALGDEARFRELFAAGASRNSPRRSWSTATAKCAARS
jgi:hypothetical protein